MTKIISGYSRRPKGRTNTRLITAPTIPAPAETLIHADEMDSKTVDETGTSPDPSPEEASK